MQRVLPLLFILFALYACGTSIPRPPVDKQPVPAAPPAPPVPFTDVLIPLPEVVDMPELLPPPDGIYEPHIALLLPLKSAIFGSVAEIVQQGFLAAANLKGSRLPIRAYGGFDENDSVVSVYRQAIANGAVAVVGPLTRNGVTALAAEKNFPVPTLALNVVETEPVPQLYFFGLVIEAEARQVARLARRQGLQQAIVISTRSSIAQRLQLAFEEEWHAMGGMILREIEFNEDPSVLSDISVTPDTVVFLATNAEKSRLIRPYLSNKFPVYSTSQIFIGNDRSLTNYDLTGIRFVDVPWLLQPDHPAVMVYPRTVPPLPADRERLYALGIDAYRLIQVLLSNSLTTSLPLDGVSGSINLEGHVFQRSPVLAIFQQGQAQLSKLPRASLGSFPTRDSAVP